MEKKHEQELSVLEALRLYREFHLPRPISADEQEKPLDKVKAVSYTHLILPAGRDTGLRFGFLTVPHRNGSMRLVWRRIMRRWNSLLHGPRRYGLPRSRSRWPRPRNKLEKKMSPGLHLPCLLYTSRCV